MRRLLAIKLIVAMLAPWIAALGGTAPGVVLCPMHRSSEGAGHAQTKGMAGHEQGAQQPRSPHHETTAHGCNCASECGRSGASVGVPTLDHVALSAIAATEQIFAPEQLTFGSFARLLPFATGPPQRLRI